MRALLWFVAGFIFIMALTYGRELMLLAVGPIFLAVRGGRQQEQLRESEERQATLDEKLESLESLGERPERALEVREWLDR